MGIAASMDITPQQRNTIVSLLKRYIPGVEVWAYGSRVKWTSRPDSDLDLVVFSTSEQQGRVSTLKEAFEESSLPFRVDVMVWDDVPENFRKNILAQYLVLVEKPVEKPEKQARINGWRLSTWGDEISLAYGKSLRGHEGSTGKYRVFGSNGPIGWTSQPLAPGPGVILGRKGAYRGVEFSQEPFFVIDTAYYVVPKSELDMRWLYYAVKHYKLGEIDDGSPIPSTTRAAVYMQDIEVPPLSEQRAIAHILGSLDDKIELNRRMNETLEVMARALFRSWFVDFEPVRAKAEGRDTGLPKEIADLFPDSFEDTKLGEVPKGWMVGKVQDIASLNRSALNPGDYEDELFDHYSIPAFDDGRTVKIELGRMIKSNKYIVTPNCLLLSKLNPHTPRIWLPTLHDSRRSICSTEFLVTLPKIGMSREFLYCLFSCDSFTNEFASLVTGTSGSHQRVTPESLLALSVVVPPQTLVQQFTKYGSLMLHRINNHISESRILAAQRDTLLPKLLSGEVRVKGLEKMVEGKL